MSAKDKSEYIELMLAEELDDVTVSLSGMVARSERIGEIQETTDEETLKKWDRRIKKILSHPDTHYCGGGLYNE